MFVVLFEVNPKPERWDDYLGYAKLLRPEIEKIDGFIDNDRFASKHRDGWLISVSTWRDEKALIRWRTLGLHHEVQEKGRNEVFRDYHLRVGELIADTRLPPGEIPHGQRFDETAVGAAKIATITELPLTDIPPGRSGDAAGRVEQDLFESIYHPGKGLLLSLWRDIGSAEAWLAGSPDMRHRSVRIIRDYGMFDRAEAPQFYPPVTRT